MAKDFVIPEEIDLTEILGLKMLKKEPSGFIYVFTNIKCCQEAGFKKFLPGVSIGHPDLKSGGIVVGITPEEERGIGERALCFFIKGKSYVYKTSCYNDYEVEAKGFFLI